MNSLFDDLAAIAPTPAAKAAASAAGANLDNALAHARQRVVELRHLVAEIIRLHPDGGDNATAASYAALQALRAKVG